MPNTTYNGWKNYETWNVALWLKNDYPLYCVTRGFAGYASPFLSLRNELKECFSYTVTKDGASLWCPSLDIQALDEYINEEKN